MTLVERLREKACAYVGDIYDEAADRIEALEAALRGIRVECAHGKNHTWIDRAARKALGESPPSSQR